MKKQKRGVAAPLPPQDEQLPQPEAPKDDRLRALLKVRNSFKDFLPARQVLRRVRAVPTRFVQFDHATRVGGLPIERFMLLHGPSNGGKSLWSIGLVGSFLELDHFALYIDAERTTPITWVEDLLGPLADHPYFFADRPETYEGTIAKVQNFLNTVIELRASGKVPEDTAAIVVVDSLRKLVPADLMREILAAEAEGSEIKAGRDRRAQIQAKMNAAWCDMLVPLLEKANAGFVAIAREMQDPDADTWAKRAGNDYKVGGGGTTYYEASLVMRVEREGWVVHGEGKERKVYGERNRVTLRKTKVAGKEDKVTVCHFHSSNGVLIPEGFDRARDVLELAVRFSVVELSGASYSYNGQRIASGIHNAVKALTEDRALLSTIESEVRSKFASHRPEEHDEETGEVG